MVDYFRFARQLKELLVMEICCPAVYHSIIPVFSGSKP